MFEINVAPMYDKNIKIAQLIPCHCLIFSHWSSLENCFNEKKNKRQ
jgi:metal-dependent hydrolase (beta-lactamase superfamily II)